MIASTIGSGCPFDTDDITGCAGTGYGKGDVPSFGSCGIGNGELWFSILTGEGDGCSGDGNIGECSLDGDDLVSLMEGVTGGGNREIHKATGTIGRDGDGLLSNCRIVGARLGRVSGFADGKGYGLVLVEPGCTGEGSGNPDSLRSALFGDGGLDAVGCGISINREGNGRGGVFTGEGEGSMGKGGDTDKCAFNRNGLVSLLVGIVGGGEGEIHCCTLLSSEDGDGQIVNLRVVVARGGRITPFGGSITRFANFDSYGLVHIELGGSPEGGSDSDSLGTISLGDGSLIPVFCRIGINRESKGSGCSIIVGYCSGSCAIRD